MKSDDILLLTLAALIVVSLWAYVKLLEIEAMVYAVDTYRMVKVAPAEARPVVNDVD